MKDTVHYIYRYIREDKNEPFYIGQGKKPENYTSFSREYSRAIAPHKSNIIFSRIKEKVEYRVEIVIDNLSKEEANQKEKEFIKLYGKICDRTGTLANFTDGGDGTLGVAYTEERRQKVSKGRTGKRHTEKSKAKISKTKKERNYKCTEERKQKLSIQLKEYWKVNEHPMKGHKATEEARQKMSESRKGKLAGGKNPAARKVVDTKTGEVYNSAKEAAAVLGLNPIRFTVRLRNERINYNNTSFIYLDDYLPYIK